MVAPVIGISKEELRVQVAMDKFGIRYRAQVPIDGGRTVRGGQVVDFVVWRPRPTPVQIFGEYWHEGSLNGEERLKLARLQNYFGTPVVIFWANDVQTQEQADAKVQEKLL